MGNACSNLISSNPSDVILLIFALLVLVICCGCIWAFFYAIFLFIFSKGDDNKVKSAWNSIRYMIIGIFLTVMLLFAGPALLGVFRMPNPENYSAKKIFTKIGTVVSCLTEGVVSIVKDPENNSPLGGFGNVYVGSSDEDISDDGETFTWEEL